MWLYLKNVQSFTFILFFNWIQKLQCWLQPNLSSVFYNKTYNSQWIHNYNTRFASKPQIIKNHITSLLNRYINYPGPRPRIGAPAQIKMHSLRHVCAFTRARQCVCVCLLWPMSERGAAAECERGKRGEGWRGWHGDASPHAPRAFRDTNTPLGARTTIRGARERRGTE